MSRPTVYLLSPANCSGRRATALLGATAASPLAAELRSPSGACVGELFTYMSGLYFRGKLVYAATFTKPPVGHRGVLVILPGRGLVAPDLRVTHEELRSIARVRVDEGNVSYRVPLVRDADRLAAALGRGGRVVLLGSVASRKYVSPLLEVFGERLYFPEAFVGRGDMSRGGLLLRCARAHRGLKYIPLQGAALRGRRPPRLTDRSVAELTW